MGYRYTISEYYKIKSIDKEYPWPCQSSPNRVIKLFSDDVLTKSEDGTYMKQTGLGCFGIIIPDADVEHITSPINLVLI